MTRLIERYSQKLQGNIVSCPNDQPCEGGEVVCWTNGSAISLQDLLMDNNVPENMWDEVVSELRCPKCDSPFDIWQEVGTKSQSDIGHEQRIEKALKRHSKKLSEFTEYLRISPLLGASHSIGKRIIKEIGSFSKSRLTNQNWFRARRVDSATPMTIDDLRLPDPNKHEIREGRFNHFGQACWYLADDSKAAASEATSLSDRLAWVQEWKIEHIHDVLDLRAWQAEDDRAFNHEGEVIEFSLLQIALIFRDHLGAKRQDEQKWHPEYLVPRFVADAARRAEFSGILFQSTRAFSNNLVLFDAQAALTPIGKPNLISLEQAEVDRRDGIFLYQGFPVSPSDIPKIGIP